MINNFENSFPRKVYIVTEDYDATMSKQHVKQCIYTSKSIHSQINARTHENKE
jgi:hypothetical protein